MNIGDLNNIEMTKIKENENKYLTQLFNSVKDSSILTIRQPNEYDLPSAPTYSCKYPFSAHLGTLTCTAHLHSFPRLSTIS